MKGLLSLTKNDLNQENLDKIEEYLKFSSYQTKYNGNNFFVFSKHKKNILYLINLVDDENMMVRLVRHHYNKQNICYKAFIELFIKNIKDNDILQNLLKEYVYSYHSNDYYSSIIPEMLISKVKNIDENILRQFIANPGLYINSFNCIAKDRDDLYVECLQRYVHSIEFFPKNKFYLLENVINSYKLNNSHRICAAILKYVDSLPNKNNSEYLNKAWKFRNDVTNNGAKISYSFNTSYADAFLNKLISSNKMNYLENIDLENKYIRLFIQKHKDKKFIFFKYIESCPHSKYASVINECLVETIL